MKNSFEALRWRYRAWRAMRRASRRDGGALPTAGVRRVVVVCYGNIYRSAYAGAYLRSRLGPAIEVRSRGFLDKPGRSSPLRHVAMAKRTGIDLSNHVSAVIVPDDLAWADLIVLMDRGNWVRLCRMDADCRKLVWLGACAPGPVEIADPYAMDDAGAERLLERLRQCCQALAVTLAGK